jgi:hypothetical protein
MMRTGQNPARRRISRMKTMAGPIPVEGKMRVYCILCDFDFILLLHYFLHSRTSTRHQSEFNPFHWSHHVTADNPHGFRKKTLDRLRAIEDPVEREKEEKKVLSNREALRRRNQDADYVLRRRKTANAREQRKRINAGYVLYRYFSISF